MTPSLIHPTTLTCLACERSYSLWQESGAADARTLVHDCPCGFTNVLEHGAIRVDLSAIHNLIRKYRGSVPEVLLADGSETNVPTYLERAVLELVRVARRLVVASPKEAADSVLSALRLSNHYLEILSNSGALLRDPLLEETARTVFRASDLLYLLAAKEGCVPVVNDLSLISPDTTFLKDFLPVASAAARLCLYLGQNEAGLCTLQLQRSELRIERTQTHARVVEANIERRRFQHEVAQKPLLVAITRSPLDLDREAQELVLGFTLESILPSLTCIAETEALEQGASCSKPELFEIDPSKLLCGAVSDPKQALFSIEGFMSQSRPFFFSLGERREKRIVNTETFCGAVRYSWSAYYPGYVVETPSGEVVGLTTTMHFATYLDNISGRRNSLMSDLYDYSASLDQQGAVAGKLKALRRSLPERAEILAGKLLASDGWITGVGVEPEGEGGKECGDIDFLAGKVVDGQLFVLLGEVKDFDTSRLGHPGVIASLQGKVQKASNQLSRKSAYVKAHWSSSFGPGLFPQEWTREVILIPILVSTQFIPHFLASKHPTVPLEALLSFSRTVTHPAGRAFPRILTECIVRIPQARSP